MGAQTEENSPFFLENKHGVVVSMPRHMAEKILNTKIGWQIAEPEDVPKEKQYPISGDLNERGLKSRMAIKKSRDLAPEKVQKEVQKEDLKQLAKEAGIKSYWMKSPEKLAKELEELNK